MANDLQRHDARSRLHALPGFELAATATPAGNYARFSEACGTLISSGVVGRESGEVISGQLTDTSSIPNGE